MPELTIEDKYKEAKVMLLGIIDQPDEPEQQDWALCGGGIIEDNLVKGTVVTRGGTYLPLMMAKPVYITLLAQLEWLWGMYESTYLNTALKDGYANQISLIHKGICK